MIINTNQLKRALSSAAKAIGSNPVLPILSDFKVSVEGNTMSVIATDLELTIIEKIEIQSTKDETFCVSARLLLDTVKEIGEDSITIESDDNKMTIKTGKAKGKYTSPIQAGKDYPEVPTMNESKVIHSTEIQRAIGKVLFAASSDELRPAMTGVLCEIEFGGMNFVTTDAHVLAKYSISQTNDTEGSFIIPKKAANIIKDLTGELEISFDKNNIKIVQGGTTIICRLIDARYPDYNAVIPRNNLDSVTIDKKALKGSLKRVIIYSNKTTKQTIFDFQNNESKISAKDLDFNNEAFETINSTVEGEGITIGFNSSYVIPCLDRLEKDTVTINYSTPTSAAIMIEDELTFLLMPVMLTN